MNGFIYCLTSPSGKKYIGQTWNLNRRWMDYKNLRCKNQIKLFYALVKYGVDNFIFEILDIVHDQESLNDSENYWIMFFDSINEGYNCRSGGSHGKHSVESLQKMSKIKMGAKNSMYGNTHTLEAREKISKIHRGTKKDGKERKRLSLLHLGVKKSFEHREKLSKAKCKFFYKIIYPSGKEEVINNLKKFCRENSLTNTCMIDVLKGKCKAHKGFKIIFLGERYDQSKV